MWTGTECQMSSSGLSLKLPLVAQSREVIHSAVREAVEAVCVRACKAV